MSRHKFGHDLGQFAAFVHRPLLEPAIGVRLRHLAVLHQDCLGALDQAPLLQKCASGRQFGFDMAVALEQRNGRSHDRPHIVECHARQIVGADASRNGFAGEGRIIGACKHHNRAGRGDGADILERVAVGQRHVHNHKVGLCPLHRPGQIAALDVHYVRKTGPGKLFFQGLRARLVGIDQQDGERHAFNMNE